MALKVVNPVELEKRKKKDLRKSHSIQWISISLSSDLYKRLERYRNENSVNVSVYIRRLIDEDLRKKGY
jgi:hypothetical protein